ncbi:MAG TPA: hypothetical protein PLQ36_03815, partial [Candidatus Gracilibacteria bacterium]|nr:hypothetical protein [Candidatus Gracilibacteria bacterium]
MSRVFIAVQDFENLKPLVDFLDKNRWEFLADDRTADYLNNEGISAQIVNLADYQNPLTQSIWQLKNIDLWVVNFQDIWLEAELQNEEESVLNCLATDNLHLLRLLAQDFENQLCLSDPNDYEKYLTNPQFDNMLRQQFATKIFIKTAQYDAQIANILYPDFASIYLQHNQDLNEKNPDITSAWYQEAQVLPANFSDSKIYECQLSASEVLDLNQAWKIVKTIKPAAYSVVYHQHLVHFELNQEIPVNLEYQFPYENCLVAFNRGINLELAEYLIQNQIKGIIAPRFDENAIALLLNKGISVLENTGINEEVPDFQMRKIEGGYLMQSNFSEELNSPQINAEQKSGVNIAWQIASLLSPGSAGIFVKNQLTFISQGQINGDQAINQVLA